MSKSSFAIATSNKKLSKKNQLELWLQFAALLDLLKKHKLEFNYRNVEVVKRNNGKLVSQALAAKDKLVFTNQALVIKVAKQYQSSSVPLEDLIQAGNVGLIKGLIKFQANKNVKVSSYLYLWIKALILELVYRSNLIYTPQKLRKSSNKLFTYISANDPDSGLDFLDGESDQSLINDVLQLLDTEEQDILLEVFNLNGNDTMLTAALMRGMSIDELEKKIKLIISKVKSYYE